MSPDTRLLQFKAVNVFDNTWNFRHFSSLKNTGQRVSARIYIGHSRGSYKFDLIYEFSTLKTPGKNPSLGSQSEYQSKQLFGMNLN